MARAGILRRLAGDRTGAVSILAAAVLTVLLAMLVLAIDLGMVLETQRRLQAATDAAALNAALYLDGDPTGDATAVLDRMMGAGNYTMTNLKLGTYVNDPTITDIPSRFTESGTPYNALRITTSADVPVFFFRLFTNTKQFTVTASATAWNLAEASFSAGTGLVQLNGGVLNAVLGGLLGSNLTLTVMDYQNLLNVNVNLLQTLNALNTQLHLTAGTYSGLLSTSVEVGDLVSAAIAALGPPESLTSVQLQALGSLQLLQMELRGHPTLQLGDLLSLGIWANHAVGETLGPTAVNATIDLLDLVTLAAQVANGQNQIAVNNLNIGLPGLLSVNLKLSIGEPAQSGPKIGLGPVGTTIHTAQTRLLLDVQVAQLLGDLLHLPVYLELAAGDARIDAITCRATSPGDSVQVTLGGKPAVAALYVGNFSSSVFTNFSQPLSNPPSVALLNVLGLVQVTGSAAANVGATGAGSYQPAIFSSTDIANGTIKTVSAQFLLSGLISSLSTSLLSSLRVSVLGLDLLGLTSGLANTVASLLSPVFAILDQLIQTVLQALGLKVGYMDLKVSGARCGIPVLVQ